MLAKLLKYELKSTGRVFLPLYGALVILSIISLLFLNLKLMLPSVISIFISNIVIIAVCVITLVLTIQRFHKNLLGNEGYLMFTLPVNTDSLILSKLIASAVWFIISGIVVAVSLIIMVGVKIDINDIATSINSLYISANNVNVSSMNINLYIFEFILFILISLFVTILMIYTCMSLSLLVNKNRALFSVGVFIGINLILQILGSVFFVNLRSVNFSYIAQHMEKTSLVHMGLLSMIAANIILGAIYYFVTRYMLKNKLNLE